MIDLAFGWLCSGGDFESFAINLEENLLDLIES
jgi:hypothetical protein